MTGQAFRTSAGGSINRSKTLSFTFNGNNYQGYEGDTLASALLANGVHLVGRSFKYHRPRGIMANGPEETNALIQLRTGARTEPNIPASQIELFDGLIANSQNCWPSVKFDVGEINNVLSGLMPVGFYYKTFMWPRSMWHTYDDLIRKAAGYGKVAQERDPDRYENRFDHCDVLVAGGGPAGMMAALAAARSGARVIVADERAAFGGALPTRSDTIDGKPASDWVSDVVAELAETANVTLLPRTCVASYYDHNMLLLVERVADHVSVPPAYMPRQRLWQVRAKQVVIATGSIERPLVFTNNDRPGVMLASAARAYANQYGVRPGSRSVVFTNNDTAYAAAIDLAAVGVEIAAIVDARPKVEADLLKIASDAGIPSIVGSAVVGVCGKKRVSAVHVSGIDGSGKSSGVPSKVTCDLVCVSGGWTPSVHLFSQARGKIEYDEKLTAFRPGVSFQQERSAGSCNGAMTLKACLEEGARAGADAAVKAGLRKNIMVKVPSASEDANAAPMPLWDIQPPRGIKGKRFVDFQHDVTTSGIALAFREGYESVEHLKRYTTLGMGTDQGRTSNVNGLAIMAMLCGKEIPEVGTTTFRPPYSPITFGTVIGSERDGYLTPYRVTPLQAWHEQAGADFVDIGSWKRAQTFRQPGEDINHSAWREAKATRESAGMSDISAIGKIDLQGRDAVEFLDAMYVNGFKTLAPGKVRYGLMLREDGMVYDDGTVTCISENHYIISTTTVKAGPVLQHLEYYSQVVWPELDVHLLSITDDWAGIAIVGPNSRRILQKIVTDVDISNQALPFMGFRTGVVAGVPVRIFRISFSGEMSFEINVPAEYGIDVWQRINSAGAQYGITPYGFEAANILRMEKGHIVGNEINGRTTAADLGFGGMLSTEKDFIGRRALNRPGLIDRKRKQFVGLVPVDGRGVIPPGAQIVKNPNRAPPNPSEGEVTSRCYSPNLEHYIALALVTGGQKRHGETLYAVAPMDDEKVEVQVTSPVFIDREGERIRG